MNTISTYEYKIEQKDTNNSTFWKNEIIKQINKAKTDINNWKTIPEKEEEIINDTRKVIQNLSKQAKSNCIHKKNKHIMSFKNKEIPKDIQKEVVYYKRLEEKRRRLEQACIW